MLFRSLGLSDANLTKADLRLYSADNDDIKLLGMIPVQFTDHVSGLSTRQIVYICEKASSVLLSLEACIDLQYVTPDFPSGQTMNVTNIAATRTGKKPECDCSCPVRAEAPDVPTELPYEPTEDNIDKLEQWIRDRYAASAFNMCECQPLPAMHGEPVKIHLQEGTTPVASHTPIPKIGRAHV